TGIVTAGIRRNSSRSAACAAIVKISSTSAQKARADDGDADARGVAPRTEVARRGALGAEEPPVVEAEAALRVGHPRPGEERHRPSREPVAEAPERDHLVLSVGSLADH